MMYGCDLEDTINVPFVFLCIEFSNIVPCCALVKNIPGCLSIKLAYNVVEYTSRQSAELEIIFSTPKTLLEAKESVKTKNKTIKSLFNQLTLNELLYFILNHPLVCY